MFKSVDQNHTSSKPVNSATDIRAIVVKQINNNFLDRDVAIFEIKELARSAGATVLAEFVTYRHTPVAATFVGSGKLEEIAQTVEELEIDIVIFDHAISPIQERNIEKIVKTRVLDRSGLILDIFSQRATSSEGKLQVELAQLKYLSTRLVRGWTHLERQKGGIGLRGPGETQLETDRRLIGKRIKILSQRLSKLDAQRHLRRRNRERTPIPTISLVGYTNAGKSTLFNRLTGAEVLTEDKLFATLDPTMRRVNLPSVGDVVLSDTVGFVKDLPHSLVAAFKSTLEEVANADCLLLVNDCADEDAEDLRREVLHVLDEINAGDIPCIFVNNKIDEIKQQATKKVNHDGQIQSVWVSAHSGEGMTMLLEAIAQRLSQDYAIRAISLPADAGDVRAFIYRYGEVLDEQYNELGEGELKVRLSVHDWGKLEKEHPELQPTNH